MPSKPSLGRGLGAMFPDLVANMEDKPLLTSCGIEEISPNRFQPRKNFHDQEQKDLIASVRKSGIIQPIVVRKNDTGYEIIAGERRWRAAQEAGLKNVPIVVRKASDVEAAELSLIENLQREGLTPLEEANAYRTLIETFGQNHDTIAGKIGKDRSTVTNTIRLLKLPAKIQQALTEKKITAGHARSLLALESDQDQLSVFNTISKHDLSVRKTEKLIQTLKNQEKAPKIIKKDVHLDDLEKKLSQTLMTRTQIRKRGKKGVIEIHFSSPEELGRLVEFLLETTS
jgi:ParB family chromosome partitioning protein